MYLSTKWLLVFVLKSSFIFLPYTELLNLLFVQGIHNDLYTLVLKGFVEYRITMNVIIYKKGFCGI